jgi:hypothetical protein
LISLQYTIVYHQHAHQHATVTQNGVEYRTTYTYTESKQIKNQTVVVQQQLKNQQQDQKRQIVENNLAVERQDANAQVALLNADTDSESSSVQQDSAILNMLQDMTVRILQLKANN